MEKLLITSVNTDLIRCQLLGAHFLKKISDAILPLRHVLLSHKDRMKSLMYMPAFYKVIIKSKDKESFLSGFPHLQIMKSSILLIPA